MPVLHIGYFRHTISILQCICKACARVLLEEPDWRTYLKRFRRPNLENIQWQALCKAVNARARQCIAHTARRERHSEEGGRAQDHTRQVPREEDHERDGEV
ncbi:uncharacterized protein LAESUDRAFT_719507 [Laetiporus sulphureus 93-53]|uniref:DNA-directed RNA polymerase n=1 Tax=Laetiporus sulphureus 93-53 TaxID=1314785 RepID=A0A165IJY3_9APHY|nr:uncharacterized protein LAESUDRAFT_719507 [Laetiporus sulphureus 93-53]KZT13183.1 hypothetical protein LAESUDRAFT_719507 [Laetiporus sulphureus 93-53]